MPSRSVQTISIRLLFSIDILDPNQHRPVSDHIQLRDPVQGRLHVALSGQVAGRIESVRPVADIVADMVREFEAVAARMGRLVG